MPATVSRFAAGLLLPSSMYIDANIVVSAATPSEKYHQHATRFFLESLKQKCGLWISTLTLDESLFNILKLLHAAAGTNYNPKNGSHNAAFAPQAASVTNRLFSVSSTKLYTPRDPRLVVDRAMVALAAQKLAPRDSFHLANALEGKIAGFATMDSDFDNLPLPPGEDLIVVKVI